MYFQVVQEKKITNKKNKSEFLAPLNKKIKNFLDFDKKNNE